VVEFAKIELLLISLCCEKDGVMQHGAAVYKMCLGTKSRMIAPPPEALPVLDPPVP
jgi:hypothetical protein